MTNPIIGYESTIDAATVTASSDPTATPKENALNWQLFNYWQPAAAASSYIDIDFGSARSIDYAAFYSSDFYTKAGASFEVYSGASSPPTTQQVNQLITTAGPKLFTFTAASARYWRIQFDTTGSESPKIQAAIIGTRLELQRGIRPTFKPPALGNFNRPHNSISEGGLLIGRSVRNEPVKFTLTTNNLTPAWVRSNWPGFLAHAEKFPFFLLPEPDSYTDEAVYCWTDGEIMPPQYAQSNLLSLSMRLHAYR